MYAHLLHQQQIPYCEFTTPLLLSLSETLIRNLIWVSQIYFKVSIFISWVSPIHCKSIWVSPILASPCLIRFLESILVFKVSSFFLGIVYDIRFVLSRLIWSISNCGFDFDGACCNRTTYQQFSTTLVQTL